MNGKSADTAFSRLTLGACQLGLPYGVANRTGQPSREEALRIIGLAAEAGIDCIDTAPGYGTSEEIIGTAIRELGLSGRLKICTKVARQLPPGAGEKEIERLIGESLRSSLDKLGLERVAVCLFHAEENFRHAPVLEKLAREGLLERQGCSVMTPAGALRALDYGYARALQLPLNLLDQRFRKSGVLRRAADAGVLVFARSAYLQGVFQMPENEVPGYLSAARPTLGRLSAMAREAGLSLPEMALRYSLSVPEATSTLVGVETAGQLSGNLEWAARGPLDPGLSREIEKSVPDLPAEILMPNLWPREDDPFRRP